MRYIIFPLCLLFCCCSPNTSKDLAEKGGTQYIYEIDTSGNPPWQAAQAITQTIAQISRRLDDSGIVARARVQRLGNNRLIIQIPPLSQQQTKQIKERIELTTNLQLRLIASSAVGGMLEQTAEKATYHEHKRQGIKQLRKYREDLAVLGYRWFPGKEREEEYLLFVADRYNITTDKFASFQRTDFSKDIAFTMNSQGRDALAAVTRWRSPVSHIFSTIPGKIVYRLRYLADIKQKACKAS